MWEINTIIHIVSKEVMRCCKFNSFLGAFTLLVDIETHIRS